MESGIFLRAKIFFRKNITKQRVIAAIGFIMLFVIYYSSEMASRNFSKMEGTFAIFGHHFPYNSLAGVFASLLTIVLIIYVVYYERVGFISSMLILTIRSVRLLIILTTGRIHASSLPAIFMTITAIVAVVFIYKRNEKIRKVQEAHRMELEEFNSSIISAFSSCIDGKDSYTNGHSLRVAKYTRMLAKQLGEKKAKVNEYYNIALLHDIGKIGIPDAVLNKPGKLTDEEYEIIKSHTTHGYEILKNVRTQDDIAVGAYYHHERFDGKGYPKGLSGYAIPWVARIIAVADTFDAMTSTRPYRKKLPLDFVVEEIKKCAGSQFDPKVVEAFIKLYNAHAFKEFE